MSQSATSRASSSPTYFCQINSLVAACLALAACKQTPAPPDPKIAEIENSIASRLRDPSSAQFRNTTLFRHSDIDVDLCGEINARNSFGGYVGFRPFIADALNGVLFSPESNSKFDSEAFQKIWNVECSGAARKQPSIDLSMRIAAQRPPLSLAGITLGMPSQRPFVAQVIGSPCPEGVPLCEGHVSSGNLNGRLSVAFDESDQVTKIHYMTSSSEIDAIVQDMIDRYGSPDLPAQGAEHNEFWAVKDTFASTYQAGTGLASIHMEVKAKAPQ